MKKIYIFALIIFLTSCTLQKEETDKKDESQVAPKVQNIPPKIKKIENIFQIQNTIYDNPEQIITLYIEYVLDKKWKISRIQVGSQQLDGETIALFDEAVKKAVTWLVLQDIETINIETEYTSLTNAFKESIATILNLRKKEENKFFLS